MTCPYCATPAEAGAKFCTYCGQRLPATAGVVGEAAFAAAPALAPPAPRPAKPDYSRFVLRSLLAVLAAAAAVYTVAWGVGRGEPPVSVATAAFVALAAAMALAARQARRELRDAAADVDVAEDARVLLVRSLVFLGIFAVIAGISGYVIGASGRETAEFLADLDRAAVMAEFISQERGRAGPAVADQLRMYNSMARELDAYYDLTARLHLAAPTYAAKFPADGTTAELKHNIAVAHQRAALLVEQAKLASELERLDRKAQQAEWERRMQPLLDREDQLD